MQWKCTGCGWIGEELVPVDGPSSIQGNVRTYACPDCGKTVSGGVIMYEPKKKVLTPAEAISEYLCRYCGKDCKSRIGRSSHERACPENPDNT